MMRPLFPTLLLMSTTASAQVSNVRYEVTFDSVAANEERIAVTMRFTAAGASAVLLSLPAWTPGAYELHNAARNVEEFTARQGDSAVTWDKSDHDTWRVRVRRGGDVSVSFRYHADSLDTSLAWSRPDFTFFNGTTVFLYPEGTFDFPAQVTVRTERNWRVATALQHTGTSTRATTFSARNYHELVDAPFFVGRFDLDSTRIAGKWMRLASYPARMLTAAATAGFWERVQKFVAPQIAVFGDVPWSVYTIMQVADSAFPEGTAAGLEHANSHLNLLSPIVVGNPRLSSLYAHEIFHAWNVKRMRPAALVPYRYDRIQSTELLWVSEGVTDYYADLSEVRGRVITPNQFYSFLADKITATAAAPPVSLEDASLSAWIKPRDGTESIYYEKGAIAGLLIDILIRDASNNARTLDHVMRELYENTYKRGSGFSDAQWWTAVARAAGRPLTDFRTRYVDGREPFPYASVLPLGGLQLVLDTTVAPGLGMSVSADEEGRRVIGLAPGGPAHRAGVEFGDYLLSIGGVQVEDPDFAQRFHARYRAARNVATLAIRVKRGERVVTLTAPAMFSILQRASVMPVAHPGEKALRVRNGLLSGTPRP